jgi:hypothetical protein
MTKPTKVLLIALSALAAVGVVASLGWRMEHDSPIMLYAGFLVKSAGVVPYRDLFDMNAPGTHILNWVIYSVAGSGDLALRVIDLLFLTGISWLTVLIMRPLGRASAWAGAVLFPIAYLQGGVAASLQREVLALLPLAGAVALFLGAGRRPASPRLRYLAVGVLVGMAASVKPQLLLALPAFFLADGLAPRDGLAGRAVWIRAATGLGRIALGVVAVDVSLAIWLASVGALGAFISMAVHYWPLYAHLSGEHILYTGSDRFVYLLRSALKGLGQFAVWYVAATFAVTSLARSGTVSPAVRRLLVVLAGMAGATWLATPVAGKFWFYHWLPLIYFSIQLAAVCLAQPVAAIYRRRPWVPVTVMLLVLVVTVSLPFDLRRQSRRGIETAKRERVDEIAGFLKANLRPGDTVQPLDWTGGAVHAMLIDRARLATSFLYDFHFYHSVSSPYIRALRRRFVGELTRSAPRYVIMVTADRPWPTGTDTSQDFPELRQVLQGEYHAVRSAETYTILERNGPR